MTEAERVDLPPPSDLGAPARYTSWRRNQDRAFTLLQTSKKRFVVLAMPTGSGKSLTYMTSAAFSGKRTLVLTSTKGLQDQVSADYEEIGLTDVRGMSNYECIAEGGTCDDGSCVDGAACYLKDRGCLYYDAVRAANASLLPSTNYSFWFTRKKHRQGMGRVDVLVADEAHTILDEMSDYLKVELGPGDPRPADADTLTIEGWAKWAAPAADRVRGAVKHAPKTERRRLRALAAKLDVLAGASGEWVVAPTARGGWTLEPLWPGPYLEEWLWQGIEQIVLASATITPYALAKMGLTKDDYDYVEFPSPLPVARRPVIHVETGVRMSWRTSEAEWEHVVAVMDDAIGARLDRKGIVHSVSYERARDIKRRSEWGEMMLVHDSRTTREVVARFKAMPSPAVLVSPSVSTGYDFAGLDDATYQLIPKVPFPDMRDPLLKARMKADKQWFAYVTLMALVQMAGRVCRTPEDIGETVVLDDQWRWLYGHNRHHTPKWFQIATRTSSRVPTPPLLISAKRT